MYHGDRCRYSQTQNREIFEVMPHTDHYISIHLEDILELKQRTKVIFAFQDIQ